MTESKNEIKTKQSDTVKKEAGNESKQQAAKIQKNFRSKFRSITGNRLIKVT